MRYTLFILLGIVFGIVMYKAEAASWFRIYEMFSFQSFHMYGFIGTALVIGIVGLQIIKRRQVRDIDGRAITLPPKQKSLSRYLIGGIAFGMGWALVGACPGPIFVLLGSGLYAMLIIIAFAILGTYVYGIIRSKLPH